jgi:hypothetical protein
MSENVFKGKISELFIGGDVICDLAKGDINELKDFDADITITIIDKLQTDINAACSKYLGIDSAKALRAATRVVLDNFEAGKLALQIAKELISNKYTEKKLTADLDEIMNTLGYNLYSKAVRDGDQEALIAHLYRYQTNLTPALKAAIVANGIPAAKLEKPLTYAQILKDANVAQEGNKKTKKENSATKTDELNALYARIIAICKLGKTTYKALKNKVKEEQYSYAATIKNMNATGGNTPPTPNA